MPIEQKKTFFNPKVKIESNHFVFSIMASNLRILNPRPGN